MYFQKEINLDDRNEMITFLKEHFRYYTMNSWNQSTSFANKVKLHSLDIPDDIYDKAYQFLDAECPEYHYDVHALITAFECDTGYTAGFNGRSSGYIVMYDTELRNGNRCIMIGRNIGQYDDYDEFEDDELRSWTKLVQRFDKLCDDIRDLFIETVQNCTISTETYMIPQTKLVANLD